MTEELMNLFQKNHLNFTQIIQKSTTHILQQTYNTKNDRTISILLNKNQLFVKMADHFSVSDYYRYQRLQQRGSIEN